MQWIDGFMKSGGILHPRIVNGDSAESEPGKLDDMCCKPALQGRKIKNKLEVDFSSFALTTATEYLIGTGVSQAERHQVYAIRVENKTYLIPAIVLARAIFRPLKNIARYLLMPQGLELLCFPSPIDASRMQIVGNAINSRLKSMNSFQQPFHWFWHYPSARRLWGSVYRHAVDGRLGVDLPHGRISMTVHGIKSGDIFRVIELVVLRILTSENIKEGEGTSPRAVSFHDGQQHRLIVPTNGGRGRALNLSITIKPRNEEWGTSDEEWANIADLLKSDRSSRKPTYSQRIIFDHILLKLGTGKIWDEFEFVHVKKSLVLWWFQIWLKDGRLMAAVDLLNFQRTNDCRNQDVN